MAAATSPPGLRVVAAVPCFVCGKELEAVSEMSPMQPYGGLMCHAPGNYGSRVHDPVYEHGSYNGSLMFLICDECITAGKDRVRQVYIEPSHPKAKYREWS